MKAIVFDTETTGLPKPRNIGPEGQPRIIELGAIAVNEHGVVEETLTQLLNPEECITEEITKITGITNEMLVGQPTFLDYLPQLKRFFSGADMLIAHNAPFDESMLRWELQRCDSENDFPMPELIVCSVQEFKHRFGYPPKLVDLYQRVMGKPLHQTHRAVDDAVALYEVLKAEEFFST